MNVESIRLYCLSLDPEVTEGFPFGETTLVFKIGGKIFCLLDLEGQPPGINLKCDPDLALRLREDYDCVRPGYHMNKKHWNTVKMEAGLPAEKVKEWINHSFELVSRQRGNHKLKSG